jgi:hypothetical protein
LGFEGGNQFYALGDGNGGLKGIKFQRTSWVMQVRRAIGEARVGHDKGPVNWNA